MPKFTRIRGYDDYDRDATFHVTSNLSDDVAEAVEREHHCDDAHCDVRASLAAGFPLVSAFLLGNVTETPLLDALFRAHEFNGTLPRDDGSPFPEGWDEWVAWWHAEHGIRCPSCDAFNYGDDWFRSESCGNCSAELPSPVDVDDVQGSCSRTLYVLDYVDGVEDGRIDGPAAGPGEDWFDVAPDGTTAASDALAARIVESLWDDGLSEFASRWVSATGQDAERFGHCLAMTAVGHGVGFDDDCPTGKLDQIKERPTIGFFEEFGCAEGEAR